jgi:hypothetical protein
MVPVGKVANHIDMLLKSGMSKAAISDASGVCRTTVLDIASRRNSRVWKSTAASILGVCVSDVFDSHYVPARKAQDIVIALNRAGYTNGYIKRHIGISRPSGIAKEKYVVASTMRKLAIFARHLAARGEINAKPINDILREYAV